MGGKSGIGERGGRGEGAVLDGGRGKVDPRRGSLSRELDWESGR